MYIPKSQRPYIGITDFMTNQQVEQIYNVFKTHRESESKRRLHVGVMMSFKTLYGHETKWTKAFPPKEKIKHIFNPISIESQEHISTREYMDLWNYTNIWNDIMFTLHYADYEKCPDIVQNLTDALMCTGPYVNALQLDMIWPDPHLVQQAIKDSGKNIEVILQIGKNAMEDADNDPQEIVERLYFYQEFLTHVLLDKSMDRELSMNAHELLPYARAIKKAYPNLGLAVAGGLGPNTVHLVEPLVAEFPDISIDAQGRLRPSGDALDPIDWDMASLYVVEALAMLK
jgi:hypothetical protein